MNKNSLYTILIVLYCASVGVVNLCASTRNLFDNVEEVNNVVEIIDVSDYMYPVNEPMYLSPGRSSYIINFGDTTRMGYVNENGEEKSVWECQTTYHAVQEAIEDGASSEAIDILLESNVSIDLNQDKSGDHRTTSELILDVLSREFTVDGIKDRIPVYRNEALVKGLYRYVPNKQRTEEIKNKINYLMHHGATWNQNDIRPRFYIEDTHQGGPKENQELHNFLENLPNAQSPAND